MKPFEYRRQLTREDWIKLAGAAAAAGSAVAVAVLYVGRLWLRRVPIPTGAAERTASETRDHVARRLRYRGRARESR